MKLMNKKIWIQFIKFGFVGGLNAVIQLGVYYILIGWKLHYVLAYAIGFVLSVLNAYLWNRKFVFMAQDLEHKSSIFKIYIAYGITFLLSEILLLLGVERLSIHAKIMPIINIIIITPINFLLNKFFVFKKKED